MADIEREKLLERTSVLKIELKAWERDFATANNGQKASREDIKNNPDIAAKYKEYNKARDIISGKIPAKIPAIPPPLPPIQSPKKRKHEDDLEITALKRQQIAKTPSKTPSKSPLRPWEIDPYESPSVSRSLFTPSKKSLGPTPQKEGLVLGLFDLLSEHGSATKSNTAHNTIAATPRKSQADIYGLMHSRTPGSRTRTRMLEAFSTPLKNREQNGQEGKTPSSVSKLVFSTPSFLRRAPLPTLNEDDNGLISPQKVRIPRKPIVRGLSSILAGLRDLEEEAADEDLEALHEMEAMETERNNGTPSKPAIKPKPKPREMEPPADILVENTQPGILGGFDSEGDLDSDAGEELGRDGLPLKVYKKKGQKRTTRRTNMKPSRAKPALKPKESTTHPGSEDELALPSDVKAIPETQDPDGEQVASDQDDPEVGNFTTARNFDSDTQSEYTASEGGTRYRRPNQEKKKSKSANKDGRIKTAARKVTALAGQNFKRLKLRNTGAKAGPGHGSRFRRTKK